MVAEEGENVKPHFTVSLGLVKDCVTDDQGRLGIRKARKMAKDNFHTSLPAVGAKTTTEEGKKMARENLQRMLFLNLLKLTEMFPRQLWQTALHVQQSLLENRLLPEGRQFVTGHCPNAFSNSSTVVTGAWQVKFWQT